MQAQNDMLAMRATIDMQAEEIRQLRAQLAGEGISFDPALRLTGQEAAVLRCLMARPIMSRMAIYNSLYADLPEHSQPEPQVISVFILHLRRKLARRHIEIETVRGQGYCLSAAAKSALRAEGEGTADGIKAKEEHA